MSKIKSRVLVLLSWDTEPIFQYTKKPSISRYFMELIDKILDKGFREKYGGLVYNWMLQGDGSIKAACDDIAYTFKEWDSKWESARENGDEIGLHFHTYVCADQWYESTDIRKYGRYLEEVIKEIKELDYDIISVRTGHNYGSPELMRKYEDLSIEIEASCSPDIVMAGGITKQSFLRRLTAHDWKFYGKAGKKDWWGAPQHPYHPSYYDHRKEGNMKILEIPVYVVNDMPFGFEDYLGITCKHIDSAFETAVQRNTIVILHGYAHNFTMDKIGFINLRRNLSYIIQVSSKYNIPFKYVTLREARDFWEKEGKKYDCIKPKDKPKHTLEDNFYRILNKPYKLWLRATHRI